MMLSPQTCILNPNPGCIQSVKPPEAIQTESTINIATMVKYQIKGKSLGILNTLLHSGPN